MKTIEEDHSSDHHCIHALVEVWLNGAELTSTRQWVLNNALWSQHVISAVAGMSVGNLPLLVLISFLDPSSIL